METSSFRQAIEAQFDCLAKKVIKRAVMKGYRDMKRREKRECSFSDLADRFRKLGLDDNLVRPSYVINVGILQAKIQERIKQDPDLNYNYENEQFLSNIIREANLMMEEKDA